MNAYIDCKEVFDKSNIITVNTREYGRIDVIPVDTLVEIPLANVKAVKYGKWLINCDGYYPYCSECKEEPKGGLMSQYCPHCGATMIDRPMDKVQIGDEVVVHGVPGKIININEYREPDRKYAVALGKDDLVFIGDDTIRKCQNCQHGNDNSGYCLDCYNSNKWYGRK